MVTTTDINWDEDLKIDPEDDFNNLIRALKQKQGFGLFFVCCAQENENDLIKRIKEEVSQRKIKVLPLDKPIDNLYDLVQPIYQEDEINILFITGLAYSLSDYELKTFGEITENRYDNFSELPSILNHLNQQRERFRDNLPLCYVFFIPLFVLKYFIKRTPDFFDWRSGYWQFTLDSDSANDKAFWLYINGTFEKYKKLSEAEKRKKILEIQDLLGVDTLEENQRINMLIELAQILIATEDLDKAIISINQAIKLQYDNNIAWFYRGNALSDLGRLEEAISSYDKALEIKPDFHQAWNNRGNVLFNLGRLEEAIYSYDKALQFKPDKDEAWDNRGIALLSLGRLEEAIISAKKALEINPNHANAYYNISCAYALQNNVSPAVKNLQRAISLDEEYREMAKTDSDFDGIRDNEQFKL